MNEIKRIIDMLEEQGEKISNIEKMLSDIQKPTSKVTSKPKQQNLPKEKKYTGLAGSLIDLTSESFFDTPKELKEIREKLKANAVFYPTTNYPDALLRLVKNKKLRRLKEDKKWKYVKYG